MIGKKEWFKRRKYSGWGITPATWQGWLYTAIMISPLVALSFMQINGAVPVILIVWVVIFAVDLADIMIHLPEDERERQHEALAERNALWVILAVLATGIAFEVAQTAVRGKDILVDPVIIIAIIAGLIAKGATNWYLDRNN
ncbi:MAG: hypothetical protein NTZ13_01740 [Candidatus Parcubacteria bacterium]|nr:hypothetical protein [Candidatus Parcubacteria bacterium]